MNQTSGQRPGVRVANFSKIALPGEHRLDFDSQDVATTVRTLRRYADLPYVFVAGKENSGTIAELLPALKAIRSACYPYAVLLTGGAALDFDDPELDIVPVGGEDPQTVQERIDRYAAARFSFDVNQLRIRNSSPLPTRVDVAIVGAGITGLYAADRLRKAGLSVCILEKSDAVGGIWTRYANHTSRVNSSECAYRLLEKKTRSNRDHSATWEILTDVARLARQVLRELYTETEVTGIEAAGDRYRIRLSRGGDEAVLESKGVILAINDRVGTPREVTWPNQAVFRGKLVAGMSDQTAGIDWRDKNVVVIGMGAFAVENTRTALEGGARHVTVVSRRHGTVCPKIVDYLNFITPYDETFQHDKKSNFLNMMYWKKTYELSGATQPECWMAKIKHPGHTISVSDIWFVGHYLKKIETVTGEISGMTESGVTVDGRRHIPADIVVNTVGFERNTPAARALSGSGEIYNTNYLAKDFMYLADAYIDDEAFNSLFGSSVLEMVKFYLEVFVMFFDSPEYDAMVKTEGVEKLPIGERKWSDYIAGAMALIRKYPDIQAVAKRQVAQRTQNFLQAHDLETYVAANKREWIDTHAMLAGRPLTEAECLPYVFEKLVKKQGLR
ncbi:MAG: FAD-dependent oxidoreductase [Desulfobacteraceae bacterium]|nr:FAD-dependent oxidoreductase [Desulfobacteraceae bacterium]